MKTKDFSGQKFNKLTAIKIVGVGINRCLMWLCRCECGNERIVNSSDLRLNRVFSCGCSNRNQGGKSRHGHTSGGQNSSTYTAWANMIRRCEEPKTHNYSRYGGRGIKVCQRWKRFDAFLEDMGEKPIGLTLERKDTNANYYPLNCELASAKKQANNKSSNRLITFDGLTLTVSQWSDRLNIPSLRQRLHRGWSIERALTCNQ